ncbi:MAG TPA: hypothetical protein VGK44_06495 [Casimicrobiaceae bacterium]
MADEALQQVEYLRFDEDGIASAPQFTPLGIERIFVEEIDQIALWTSPPRPLS